ncbi:AAA family ATPase [Cellvibrio sp. ARAG 10.3]|uniref:AAA family ATPase n=1 Tax=Cellvibrio sp. ARAG 10.3 TaxID=3451358 RepID=UPI003F484B8A
MSRPQFVLVAGPNGAGKSTLTLSIKHRFPNIEVVDPDAIAKGMTGSFATVDQEQVSAGKRTLELVKQHIENGQSLIVESTISGSTYLNYAKMAKEAGFRTIFIYVCLSSADMSAQRVAKRVSFGGHAIPLEDVKRRYPRSMGNLRIYIKAFESAHIYDNSEHYRWLAGYRNGLIHNASTNIPQWLVPYLP